MVALRGERGTALVLAVFVLTVIGALVAAAFFAGLQEQRMATASRLMRRAQGAAEREAAMVMRQWPEAASRLSVYPADSLPISAQSVIRRLTERVFFLDVRGHDPSRAAQYRIGVLLALVPPCDSPAAEGLEMPQSKCHIDNAFQETGKVMPLRSRAWIHTF